MTSHRRSYWKTVVAVSLVAVGTGVLLVGLIAAAWLRRGPWGPGGWLAWGGCTVILAAVAGWATLVVSGGFIGLHRDALEAQGVPYAPRRPREWGPGPPVRAVRRVLRLIRQTVQGRSVSLDLRPGELVEVRSVPEILATLDERGTLDGLPFMPEMATFCGGQFRVLRRVDKLNDWVGHTGLRRVRDTVLLDRLRCDGGHHGACQANCHLRWKEAWLKRPSIGTAGRRDATVGVAPSRPARHGTLDEGDLRRLAQRVAEPGGVFYVCQVTELAAGTTPLAWEDPRHYLRDLVRGNVRLGPLLVGVSVALFNGVQRKRGGVRFPCYNLTERKASPHEVLDLRPGERVRVKRKREIEPTLNSRSRNRGLWFDAEMLRFCGGEYRVLMRVERLIEESTGKLIHLANPCIMLDGVTASGEYLGFCAQNEAILWREIWLTRA
jgi:hypothetical protein